MSEAGRKKQAGKRKNLLHEDGMTYEGYASLDDGQRYELVAGKLELMSPAPSVTHQLISFELQMEIAGSCGDEYIILNAPVDLILDRHEVRQPDLVIISRKRMQILSNRGVEGAPDLVVEILSPSTVKRDKLDKIKSYAQYHIPEYWIVDPSNESLEQYVLMENRYELLNLFQDDETIASPNLTCLSFSMKQIMDRVPEID